MRVMALQLRESGCTIGVGQYGDGFKWFERCRLFNNAVAHGGMFR